MTVVCVLPVSACLSLQTMKMCLVASQTVILHLAAEEYNVDLNLSLCVCERE